MADRIDTAPPGVYMRPFGPEVPGTEVVRPRITQVIPAKYASVLVHHTGVSATTVYTEIYGMLEADAMLKACGDVLSWLRVAATARGGAGGLAAPLPAVAQHFPLVLMPPTVSEYVADKVGRNLPGRKANTSATTAQRDDGGMAAAMRQLAENMLGTDRGSHDVRGVAEAYRETYLVLQRFCHIDIIEGLTPIWTRLARGVKGEVLSILQQEMNRVCTGRGLATDIYCPTVTASKLKQLLVTGLGFIGHGQDDITSGCCQPFLVAYTGPEDHYRPRDGVGRHS